jgi:hypothetical protein
LARYDEIGAAADEAYLDDIHQLLGRRPDDWLAADTELERFVLADAEEGRHDIELLHLFHRRHLRNQMLNGPQGSAMARHNSMQRFNA